MASNLIAMASNLPAMGADHELFNGRLVMKSAKRHLVRSGENQKESRGCAPSSPCMSMDYMDGQCSIHGLF